jgi:hypothetical protein
MQRPNPPNQINFPPPPVVYHLPMMGQQHFPAAPGGYYPGVQLQPQFGHNIILQPTFTPQQNPYQKIQMIPSNYIQKRTERSKNPLKLLKNKK